MTPATLWRADSGTVIPLATDSRDDSGHDIFHVNAGGGLACASCHPEGGEDGRVWNFVCAGARRTQSIRGGISPTAPFHWDGSETNFSRLMDDVFSGRMAGPMLSDDQKNSLQAWVDTIPALPETAGLDAAAVDRGKTLFNDPKVACATCHAGTLLTNNATRSKSVGTGQALQVPSLRGVSWRAPLMHNGCATTLADRFGASSCSGGDKHGVTSTLTTSQVGDLTTYLQIHNRGLGLRPAQRSFAARSGASAGPYQGPNWGSGARRPRSERRRSRDYRVPSVVDRFAARGERRRSGPTTRPELSGSRAPRCGACGAACRRA